MNKRNCECCKGTYVTGKNYGDFWLELSMAEKTKGLCEFCNPTSNWYIKDKYCHKLYENNKKQ